MFGPEPVGTVPSVRRRDATKKSSREGDSALTPRTRANGTATTAKAAEASPAGRSGRCRSTPGFGTAVDTRNPVPEVVTMTRVAMVFLLMMLPGCGLIRPGACDVQTMLDRCAVHAARAQTAQSPHAPAMASAMPDAAASPILKAASPSQREKSAAEPPQAPLPAERRHRPDPLPPTGLPMVSAVPEDVPFPVNEEEYQ